MPMILPISRKGRIKKTPMALFYPLISVNLQHLRHTCEQDEGRACYGWTADHIRKGGMQIINNTGNNLDLIAQFATAPDDECGGKWWLESKRYPQGECMWPP